MPAPPQKFGGKIEPTTKGSKPYWPARIVPPKGAPNVLLIMTDDAGYGIPSTFGGVIPTPALDRIARERAALHELPLNRTLFADARGPHHGAQPPLGRLRCHLGAGDRISGIRQHHHHGQGDGRSHPEGKRLPHVVVRQEPQHAVVRGDVHRPVRPVADRAGVRVFLWLHGRRHQPVGAGQSRPQHHVHLPVPRQPELQPDHRDGRRGDRVPEPGQHADARPAVLRLLRAGRHARAASPDAGVDQEGERHAPVRRWLEQVAREDLREPEEARRHSGQHQAHAVAQGPAEGVGPAQCR